MFLIDLIKKLFDRRPVESQEAREDDRQAARKYENTDDINFVAISAKKLANLTVAESKVNITGSGDSMPPRAEMINRIISRFWGRQSLRATAMAYGYGGVYIIPYIVANEIYIDVVPQNRAVTTRRIGDHIVGLSVMAEKRVTANNVYYRITDYDIDGNVYRIRNKAVRDGQEVSLSTIDEWAGMTGEIEIVGVDRMLLGALPCPNNRRDHDDGGLTGAAITYGNDKLLADIQQCLNDIRSEYKNKQVRIFADETMLDDKDELSSTIYKKLMVGGHLENGNFFEIFDPAIRDSAYFSRLNMLFDLFEKSIGVSKGLLTDPITGHATATEIKRANYDTYALVEAMRKKWENAMDDLTYAINVFLNLTGGTPQADYEVQWDWGYSLIENTEETWAQLNEGQSAGVISKAELRQFLRFDESIDEAQAAIDEITAQEPTLSQLLGGTVNGGAVEK